LLTFASADVEWSSRALGGDSYVKGYLQAANYRMISPRLLVAVSARLGLGWTLGPSEPAELPLPDRFFAGGDYSLRGFAQDMAGPLAASSTGALVPIGGNALLLGGVELRFDAWAHFQLAAFSDVGNVYAVVPEMSLDDLRYTAGIGLRYRSALGPLRIDYGFKLNRRSGESPGHLHVTVGYAF